MRPPPVTELRDAVKAFEVLPLQLCALGREYGDRGRGRHGERRPLDVGRVRVDGDDECELAYGTAGHGTGDQDTDRVGDRESDAGGA